MLADGQLFKARQYIEAHSKAEPGKKYEYYPCITISRQPGAGAEIIADKLIKYLVKHNYPEAPQWTLFDKNLIAKVLEDYHLPLHLEKYLEEEKHSAVTSLFTELITGEPSTWALISKEMQTIYQLARTGNVVIIGRGANFITSKLKNCFHVRVVAPLDVRIRNIEESADLSRKEAEQFLKRDDAAKENFIFGHFNQHMDSPIHYHLVINTGMTHYTEAAKMVGRIVLRRFRKSTHPSPGVSGIIK